MQSTDKNLYSILGVPPDATAEEVRDAYRTRARIADPDRFDAKRFPKIWQEANEMLAELNAAYAVLGDSEKRRSYDAAQENGSPSRSTPESSPNRQSNPNDVHADDVSGWSTAGELSAGRVMFADLPQDTQAKLLRREANNGLDQFHTKLDSIAWNYVFLGACACWFVFLYAILDQAKWEGQAYFWYASLTVVAGLLIGRNVLTITRWKTAHLHSFFYVTPLYFIRTEYDIVTFRPIWTLSDFSVTHNYRNGSYQGSAVSLIFGSQSESITVPSRQKLDSMINCIRRFDSLARAALGNCQLSYISENDDFRGVDRSRPLHRHLISGTTRITIYGLSVLVCIAGFAALYDLNTKSYDRRWVRHEVPSSVPARKTRSKAAKAPGSLIDQIEAFKQGKVSGTPSRQEGSTKRNTPLLEQQPVVGPSFPEQPLPENGSLQSFGSEERIAPFEVRAAQGTNYLVKLVNTTKMSPVLTVFIRSGLSVNVDVPLGTYEVRYASGELWYGYEYLFGPDTEYSKVDKLLTFNIEGNQVAGYTITLYKVPNGNLNTSRIKPSEF